MRRTLSTSLLALIAAIGLSACSNAASSAAADNNAANSAAADNSASSDNMAATTPVDTSAASMAPASSTAPAGADAPAPIYPGALLTPRPKGIADGAPLEAKAYVTADGFTKVTAWYRANLKGAPELGAPDNAKNKDVFLLGHGASGSVVMIQSVGGKTWIITGPAVPGK